MEQKKLSAPDNTYTRRMDTIWQDTQNVYESVAIIAKRANEIASEETKELNAKIEKLNSKGQTNEPTTEEISMDDDRIALSLHYERLPKATLRATTEFVNGELCYEDEEKPIEDEEE